jgi:uncharacterized repeat protein (TIGR01451 family)
MQLRSHPSLRAGDGRGVPDRCDAGLHAERRRGLMMAGWGVALLAALLALSGALATRADASTITLTSGITPVSYSIEGGGTGTAVNKCTNGGWVAPLAGGSWIGVTTDCTVGDVASNHTTDYNVTFTLPPGFTAPVLSIVEAVDDIGKVFLNGHEIESAVSSYFADTTTTTTPAQAGDFTAGTNTLDIQDGDTGGPNGVDFNATMSFTSANLSLTKTAAPVTPPGCTPAQATQAGTTTPCVLHGQNVTYTLAEANAGPDTATTPTITDTLPAGQSFVSSDDGCTAAGTPVVVTCPTADLPSGSSDTIHIVASTAGVPAPLTGPLAQTDNASVGSTTGDPDTSNNAASAVINVIPAADLSLSKTSSPNPVIGNQQLTYTLTATNNGPDPAVNTTIVDTLPAGEMFATEGSVELVRNTLGGGASVVGNAPSAAALAAAASSAGCTVATSGGIQTVTCPVGTLASGGSATVQLLVIAPTTAGPAVNNATVSSSTADPNGANNTATATTTVSPECTSTRTGSISGGVDVEAGTFLCLTNATVSGVVQVDKGGGLTETNSTTGPVQAESPAFVTVCGSTVNGSVVVHNATGLVRVGDDKDNCAPNHVSGAVTLTSNTGGAAGPAIVGNRITGTLDCKSNVPVATDQGVTNPTTGAKLHECSGAAF